MKEMSMLRWFLDKPYTKAMYISALATCIMTVVAAIMTWTLVQNSSALKLSADALNLQKSEFRIRNRPRLIYTEPQFRGEALDQSGKIYPHHIYVKVLNYGDLPATDARTVADFYIDGKRVFGTVIPATIYTKADLKGIQLYIPEDVFSAVTPLKHELRIQCKTTYSGVIGDEQDRFEIGTEFKYYPGDGSIRPERIWTEDGMK